MADCNFSANFQGSAQSVFNAAQQKIQQEGGTINGDASSGTFSVTKADLTVKGSYTINGQTLNVKIDHKPIFITCGEIESAVKKFLSSQTLA